MKFSLTIIFFLLSIFVFGQINAETELCDKTKKIDSIEYKKNFIKAYPLSKTKKYKKNKNRITVATKDTIFIFKDEFEKDGYRATSNSVYGADTIKNWVIIRSSWEQASTYYLVNLKNSTIDTLVGKPQIYKDRIVCVEDEFTDGRERIQIWTITQDKIVLNQTFAPHHCDVYGIYRFFLNNNTLYLCCFGGGKWDRKYYKFKID